GGDVPGRMKLVQAIAYGWLGRLADMERCATEAMDLLRRGSDTWYDAMGHLAMALGDSGDDVRLVALAREFVDMDAGPPSAARVIAACHFARALLRTAIPDLARSIFEDAYTA